VHKAIVSSVRTSYSICMTGLEKPARSTLLDQGLSSPAQFIHRDLEQRFETFVGRARLEGTDLEIFADRVAEQLVELNFIHFFRERRRCNQADSARHHGER
jgi:hypothetical protein